MRAHPGILIMHAWHLHEQAKLHTRSGIAHIWIHKTFLVYLVGRNIDGTLFRAT